MKDYRLVFSKQIAQRAILTYFIALALVSIVYFNYTMHWGFIALGILFVVGFFLLTSRWGKDWGARPDSLFVRNIFLSALILRLIWVFGSYFYYINSYGTPFEFDSADALSYHDYASWINRSFRTIWDIFALFFTPENFDGISDIGYPLYLTLLYRLFGESILIPRIIKAFISAFTCVLVYKISSRTFGEATGRLSGIMMALMPNLIIYCGYHLKETEMLFLEVAFLERLDYFIRNRKASFWGILPPSLLAGSLFFFRTVLGAAAVFTLVSTILFSSAPHMKKGMKRLAYFGWGMLCIVVLLGGKASTEIEGYWEQKDTNQSKRRYEQTARGNQWAQYATGTVMAPMVLVLPFSTMVNLDMQYAQQTKHGGNFIRNFMGYFAILAIYEALRRKKWRDFVLIGAFTISYLGVVSVSGFSNSERFLLPGLPGLVMMWSYGYSSLREKTYKLLTPWCVIVVLMEFAWAYFKLGSRGLL